MSSLAAQPLAYRDGSDDALIARYHARRLFAAWVVTPAIVLLAFTGVGFYFVGTCCAVWATAMSTASLSTAAGWMLASVAAFATGCLVMLVADSLERAFT